MKVINVNYANGFYIVITLFFVVFIQALNKNGNLTYKTKSSSACAANA